MLNESYKISSAICVLLFFLPHILPIFFIELSQSKTVFCLFFYFPVFHGHTRSIQILHVYKLVNSLVKHPVCLKAF